MCTERLRKRDNCRREGHARSRFDHRVCTPMILHMGASCSAHLDHFLWQRIKLRICTARLSLR
jgi:hypothetical protein